MAEYLKILNRKTIKRLLCGGLLVLLFSIWLWPVKISFSQEAVTVSAFVESDVDSGNSSLTLNPTTIIADNSEASTITVTLRDSGGNPLANLKVVPSSNRGAIDTINPAQTNTNGSGRAFFTIKSSTAGKATISAYVDNAVTLGDTEVLTFKRPPSPTPIKVTTKIPALFGMPEQTITLFKPSEAEDENALVEQGMELQIPFAAFLLGSVFVVSQPCLLAIIITQTIIYRKRDKKILEKEEEIIDHEEDIAEKIDRNDNPPGSDIK